MYKNYYFPHFTEKENWGSEMLNNLSKVKYVGWRHDSSSQLKFSSAPQPYPLAIIR